MSEGDASLAQKVRNKQQQLSPDAINMAAADGQQKDRLDGVAPRARDTMDGKFCLVRALPLADVLVI